MTEISRRVWTPSLPYSDDELWGNAELKARLRLIRQDRKCTGVEHCPRDASRFSELCEQHMFPAEKNAVFLAEGVLELVAKFAEQAESEQHLRAALDKFRILTAPNE